MLKIIQLPFAGFSNNLAYVIRQANTNKVAIVDPGSATELLSYCETHDLQITKVLITHSHGDHWQGLKDIIVAFPEVEVIAHQRTLERIKQSGRAVMETDEIYFNPQDYCRVLHTPGHCDDSLCFYFAPETLAGSDNPALITGDTLFVEGCGHTRLPFSDPHDLWQSLQRIVSELPKETLVYPGHDYGSKPVSNLAWEIEYNPYLLCESEEEFVKKRVG